jgi:hypothetical protein
VSLSDLLLFFRPVLDRTTSATKVTASAGETPHAAAEETEEQPTLECFAFIASSSNFCERVNSVPQLVMANRKVELIFIIITIIIYIYIFVCVCLCVCVCVCVERESECVC